MMMMSALRVQVTTHGKFEDSCGSPRARAGGRPPVGSHHHASCASTPSPVASSGCWDFRNAAAATEPQTPAPAWGAPAAAVQAPHRRLKVALPCESDDVDCSDAPAAPLSSAARVLNITGEHSAMSSWLDQQVCCQQHAAGQPARAAAAAEHVEPAVESPATTCSHVLRSLPAPAFQLLGLL